MSVSKQIAEPNWSPAEEYEACPLCAGTKVFSYLEAPDHFHGRTERYSLLRCAKCGGVWTSNAPAPDQMGLHYSDKYHKVMAHGAEYKGGKRWSIHQSIIERYKQRGSLLDVGCSSGSFLASMKGLNWNLYGIEMDAEMARRAREGSGAEVFVGDILEAAYPAEAFDVVTAFDVLEHMYDPSEFLEKVMYWLKPGGIFFAKVPNIYSWEARLFGSYWYGLELPRHLHHYSPQSLRKVAENLNAPVLYLSATQVDSHAVHSIRYLSQAFLRKLGFQPTPMCDAGMPSVAWRILRKIFRTAVIAPFSRCASASNAGVVIDLVLQKRVA